MYLLLITLPIIRSLLFWSYLWQVKEYRLDRFVDFFKASKGWKTLFNFWTAIRLIVLGFFVYNYLFQYLIFSNIIELILSIVFMAESLYFVTQIVRKKVKCPAYTKRQIINFVFALLLCAFLVYLSGKSHFNFVFASMIYICMPILIGFSILVLFPITYVMKKKIISNATKKIKESSYLSRVGVTGSFGKSSVKHFIYILLQAKYSTLETPANNNTPLGISNTIMNLLNEKHEFFVCEMGAYRKGEIRELGRIVDHKDGFLTGINYQHYSLFGSLGNIKSGKFEICEKIQENGGTLYANGDNLFIIEKLEEQEYLSLNKILYSIKNPKADAYSQILRVGKDLKVDFRFRYKDIDAIFSVATLGSHSILNLTGAIAYALDMGLSENDIRDRLKFIKTQKGNLSPELVGKKVLIDDAYNANYDGALAACESAGFFNKEKNVLIINDILELGSNSKMLHSKLGKEVGRFGFDYVFHTGENFYKYFKDSYKGKNIFCLSEDGNLFSEMFDKALDKCDVFLFEGSGARYWLNKAQKKLSKNNNE